MTSLPPTPRPEAFKDEIQFSKVYPNTFLQQFEFFQLKAVWLAVTEIWTPISILHLRNSPLNKNTQKAGQRYRIKG